MSRTQPIPKQKRGPNGERLCRWCEALVPKGRLTFCSAACVHEGMLRSDPGYLRRMTKERDHGVCAACGTDTEAIKDNYRKVATVAKGGIYAYDKLKKQAMHRYGVTGDRLYSVLNRMSHADARSWVETERSRAIKTWELNRASAAAAGRPFAKEHPDACMFSTHRWQRIMDDSIELTWNEAQLVKAAKRMKRLAEARRKRIGADLLAAGYRGSIETHRLTNLWQADHIVPVIEGGGACGLENIQTLCTPCHKKDTAELARRRALRRRGIDPDAPPEPDPQQTFDL